VESGEHPVARGGRGLGLAFCRLAIEAHGGRIWVEDGAPGAVFCMRLPHGP
jgi:two-component system sensor histidine kinase/response regulator